MASTFKPPGQCPACGEWVPRGAAACDDCGACAKSGWKAEAATYDGLDLPDDSDDFDYDDFVAREFGGPDGKPREKATLTGLWWWVGLALIVILVVGYLLQVIRS